jgi:hypothetical protein
MKYSEGKIGGLIRLMKNIKLFICHINHNIYVIYEKFLYIY